MLGKFLQYYDGKYLLHFNISAPLLKRPNILRKFKIAKLFLTVSLFDNLLHNLLFIAISAFASWQAGSAQVIINDTFGFDTKDVNK